jgi:ATP/maltotriose-dependent transcriptional regulator MalT
MTGDGGGTPILESKFYPATGTRRPLPRSRLDSLSEVLDGGYPVILVDAPAGYGKSTLMTRWHAQLVEQDVACAWLSLDKNDDDKVRFMRHLLAALRKAGAPAGQRAAANLPGLPDSTTSLLELLAGELARLPQRLALFLDDLHLVEEPEVLEIVDWLVNYAPRTVQLIIGTREKHHLRLSGLRLRGELFELNSRQLRFDSAEASQFYRSRLGRDLSPQELHRVLMKTEGWPAALELVALALAGLAEQSAFIEHFSGTDSSVVEYLGEAVVSRMDERTRTFVYRISMFDRISAALAKAVGEIEDAGELLQVLRTGNLFLIPLDQSAAWVRFHHLVGEFFRERYQRTANSDARECLVRGAHWLHDNGYVEEAVNCMIRAQKWEQASRWVADSLEELVFRRGYHQTILRWMKALPDNYVDHHPIIRIQYAFALAFQPRDRDYEAQIHRLQDLLRELEARPDHDASLIGELRCAVELLTAMSAGLRDEGELGGKLAAQWLARWPNESLRRKGVMGNVLAFGHKTLGEIEQGLQVIGETRRWLEQAEGFYALAWTAFLDAVLHLKRGSYFNAKIACNNGLELVERELRGHLPQASMLHALLAGIAYEFDEIDQAVEHIERAMSGVNDGHADAIIVAYLTQARLQRRRHDEGSALTILREGQEVGERRGLKRVTLSLAAEECTGLARAGHYEDARLVAARFGFDELRVRSGASDLTSDKALRAASRYLLLQSPQLVIQALDDAIDHCRRSDLAHRSVELLLLRAIAHNRNGNAASASTDLADALTIAAPRGYLRVFLDEGRELAALLDRLDLERLRGSPSAPLARRLQHAMGKSDSRQTSGLREGLTRREVSILKRLETGLSNKEIAEAIFVSEGTLKWHLHNIYSKLDVKNRSGAMMRARTMGVL